MREVGMSVNTVSQSQGTAWKAAPGQAAAFPVRTVQEAAYLAALAAAPAALLITSQHMLRAAVSPSPLIAIGGLGLFAASLAMVATRRAHIPSKPLTRALPIIALITLALAILPSAQALPGALLIISTAATLVLSALCLFARFHDLAPRSARALAILPIAGKAGGAAAAFVLPHILTPSLAFAGALLGVFLLTAQAGSLTRSLAGHPRKVAALGFALGACIAAAVTGPADLLTTAQIAAAAIALLLAAAAAPVRIVAIIACLVITASASLETARPIVPPSMASMDRA